MSGERRILLLQGHPDTSAPHLCHALAQAYAQGAEEGGHEVRSIDVARIDFPLLLSQHEWEHGALPVQLKAAQEAIALPPEIRHMTVWSPISPERKLDDEEEIHRGADHWLPA